MRSVTRYSPPVPSTAVDLDLSRNEGRPPSASLLESVENESALVGRYPDLTSLTRSVAAFVGVEPIQVLITAGGDDALFRCCLSRLGPGRTAVATFPSFEMIAHYTEQVGGRLVEVDWWQGSFPTDEVIEAADTDTDILFVVSPNNPTGSVIDEDSLRVVADHFPVVVLDAAYAEFADVDLTAAALSLDNVVMIRTFSKAWGLAGLRVGYLVGPPDLIAEIGGFGSPYPVSGLSAALAMNRLFAAREVAGFVDAVKHQRGDLADLLRAQQVETLPSQGNFVLARCVDADWVAAAAASLGVGIRRFPNRPGLEEHIRITLPGTDDGFRRLVHVLLSAISPEALLFDMDGVLVDVSRSQIVAIVETAASFGVAVTRRQITDAQSEGNSSDDWKLTKRLCADAGIDVALSEVTERYETIYHGSISRRGLKLTEQPLLDATTLSRWAARLPIGVVTGRPRSDAEEFLERSGLRDLISVVVTRDDAPLKPDPGPIRLALEQLGTRRAWMLGDTPDDIAAARSAGVVPIGVIAPGVSPEVARQSLRDAARVLDKTIDLEGMLP